MKYKSSCWSLNSCQYLQKHLFLKWKCKNFYAQAVNVQFLTMVVVFLSFKYTPRLPTEPSKQPLAVALIWGVRPTSFSYWPKEKGPCPFCCTRLLLLGHKKCAEDRGWVGGVRNSTYLRDIIFVQWCECFALNPTEEIWSVKCTAKELRRSTQKLDLCIFSATILFHLLPGQITMVTCFCCLQGNFVPCNW